MQPQNLIKVPVIETDRQKLQAKIAHASEELYKVAKAAYGPGAGNVGIGYRHGAPQISRDGVKNMSQVRLTDPIEDDIILALRQASEKNNKIVGDGTTAADILAHHLLIDAQKMEGQHINPMEIEARLKKAEKIALDYIETLKLEPGPKLKLVDVATVACGDVALGQLIADTIEEIGANGGAIIEPYDGLGYHAKLTQGFYFGKGYTDTELINDPSSNQAEYTDVPILVATAPIQTEVDMGPIIRKTVEAGHQRLVVIGSFGQPALSMLRKARSQGLIMVTPVEPPYVAGGRSLFLEDLALMVGGRVYGGSSYDPTDHLGKAEQVLITEWATTIMGGDANPEALSQRIRNLEKQIEELDSPGSIRFAKDRVARLSGKMAIIQVGGATEFERDEVKERVLDAVSAVQSAMKEGVVPGGGVTLAHITGTDFDAAFKEPFRQLAANCGHNPDELLAKLDPKDAWKGYNLREPVADLSIAENGSTIRTLKNPINLQKAGIVDPTLVVKEVVRNSISIVGKLITASAWIARPEDDKE